MTYTLKRSYLRGMAYIGLLFTLMLMAIALTKMLPVLSQQSQREKEVELLWMGQQYQTAIRDYYSNSPGNIKQYPKELSELLEDRRFFGIKRHLKKPYRDPMTNKEWGMIKTPEGGIKAVYSQSTEKPIKQANFPEGFERFNGKLHYSDWIFGDVS
jgi:type II secretory pathway pseudopilin PulG